MRILITGGTGLVGGNLAVHAPTLGHEVWVSDVVPAPLPLPQVQWRVADITNLDAVQALFAEARPEVVIHCGAISNIDQAEKQPELAWRVNVEGSRHIAQCSADHGARMLACSTDTVFDGEKGGYTEDDRPAPVNRYGQTKVAMEGIVQSTVLSWVITRLSMVYGLPALPGPPAYLERLLGALREGKPTAHSESELRTPVDVLTVRDALLELAVGDYLGFMHLAGTDKVTRRDLALRIARRMKADESLIQVQTATDAATKAPRPRDATLDCARARQCLHTPMLSLEAGLERVLSV